MSYTAEMKAEIIRKHFIDGKPVGRICQEYQIKQTTFEKWANELFVNSDLVYKKKPDDGMDYYQNYDLVINWMSQTFRGQTLEVIGVKTGPIKRICSYKPVEIAVAMGVVDVIFEDDNGCCYHLEEQRDMAEIDLFRFASQHFSVAREWINAYDIILISGKPYNGPREIITKSGKYQPIFVDLTVRDGRKRLEEIRESVEKGDMSSLLELVFIPLYGIESNELKKQFIKQVMDFETSLYKQNKISDLILAATLIMANKIIDKQTFNELWRDINMANIFKFAHEKGVDEGLKQGMEQGQKNALQTSVIEALEISKGVVIPSAISNRIYSINKTDTLKSLHRQAILCRDLESFDKQLDTVIQYNSHQAVAQ